MHEVGVSQVSVQISGYRSLHCMLARSWLPSILRARLPPRTDTYLSKIPFRTMVVNVPNTPPHRFPAPEDWPAAKVRQTFIDYFTKQEGLEHTFWPSSSVIPYDDPTLLFANAVST